MGKKGTADINKLSSTYIVLKDTITKFEDNTAVVLASEAKIREENDANADPQTREQLEEFCKQVRATYDVAAENIKLVSDQLDAMIGKVMEIDKKSQARMATATESAAAGKRNMMGGKR